MNRFVVLSFVTSVALLTGCKKADNSAKLAEFKTQMCACKAKACVDQVNADMTKWSAEHKTSEPSEAEKKQLDELTACVGNVAKAETEALAAKAAEADAKAKADAEAKAKADAEAQAVKGPDGQDLKHRAGMCPSTVVGATTTSAVKGKTVVVTVSAADKDAIAAIQTRTEQLLGEKDDAKAPKADAANAHDMRGTHGGGQGMCPVFIPTGATAKAANNAKGVAVTITPKDKAADLGKDIAARIPKAADWVAANMKTGDKNNQGGVGGGKNKDGSNHSGKGDGKGHERKTGTGGGAGTGGGGAAGTGGGDKAAGSAAGGW